MADYDYDLFVIGAGSGGVRAARLAASEHGARVMIAEADRIGGTCVIRGCVPKKLFVHASHFAEAFEDAIGFGWTTEKVSFDWPTLRDNVAADVSWLSSMYVRNLEKAGVEIVASRAVLDDPHTVRLVGEDRTVTAKTILIATGGHPTVDTSVPGVEHTLVSDAMFGLETLPKRLLIIGGGYIACEFAGIVAGLGVQTTLLYRGDEILRHFDGDIRKTVHAGLERHGVDIVTGDVAVRFDKDGKGITTTTRCGATLVTDQVLCAIGRTPNSRGLGLEAIGVRISEDDAIMVDEMSKTSLDNIYAVGDVTNRVALTPVAIREGAAFVKTVFAGRPTKVDYDFIPTAVFTQPEVGTVGLSEEAAKEELVAVDIYRTTFKPLPNRVAGRDERMMIKLVVDGTTDRVVGCHFVGPSAAELVQAVAIAVKMGATKADFDATVALHPTIGEEIVTLGAPAERYRRAAAE